MISLVSGWSAADKRKLSDTIHNALVSAFAIPTDDYNHRIVEYKPSDFILPAGKSEKFVLIEMTVFPGRSADAKAKLYKEIVDGLEKLGVPKSDVLIVLNEPPMENWGVRGGQRGDTVNIGFNLKV